MKILLAEDEAQLARVLKLAMTSSGYQVDAVDNGQKVVDLAAANAYDVMILDIMMPVKSGLDALRELRARGRPHLCHYADGDGGGRRPGDWSGRGGG